MRDDGLNGQVGLIRRTDNLESIAQSEAQSTVDGVADDPALLRREGDLRGRFGRKSSFYQPHGLGAENVLLVDAND
jgi:hypothetical protein